MVTLITLDDFAVCAREDKKEKAARVSGLSGYLCKGYPDNGHPTVIVGSSVARVNSVRMGEAAAFTGRLCIRLGNRPSRYGSGELPAHDQMHRASGS
jgi:hypothetical protein